MSDLTFETLRFAINLPRMPCKLCQHERFHSLKSIFLEFYDTIKFYIFHYRAQKNDNTLVYVEKQSSAHSIQTSEI